MTDQPSPARFLKKFLVVGRILPALLVLPVLAWASSGPKASTTLTQGSGTPPAALAPATRFTHLTAEDGLAENVVQAIVQDKQGFMWFGTQNGLSRYDGYRFTTYRNDPDNPSSLSSNNINALTVDSAGQLWVATEGGGIDRFDPDTETFIRFVPDPQNPNSLTGDRYNTAFQDSQGNLWFGGIPVMGLNRLNPTTHAFTRFFPADNDPKTYAGGAVRKTAEPTPGQLWFATDGTLVHYDMLSGRFASYRPVPPDGRINALQVDSGGVLWAGGQQGLYKVDAQGGLTNYPTPKQVMDLTGDETGNLWIASQSGLYIFDPQMGQVIQHYHSDPSDPQGLNSDQLTVLYRDRAGVLWIGTEQSGLNIYDPRQTRFALYQHQAATAMSLSPGVVNAIDAPDANQAWVAADTVLNRIDFKTGEIQQFTPPTSNGVSSPIRSVYQDRSGVVWVGQEGRRLLRLDPATGQFTVFALPPPGPQAPPTGGNPPPGNGPANGGNPPAGGGPPSGGGLPEDSGPPGGGPPSSIVSLYEDNQGALWVIVDQQGLYRLDPQRQQVQYFESPRIPAGPAVPVGVPTTDLPHLPLTSITSDRAGHLWIGTWNGFERFDPSTGQFQIFRTQPDPTGPDSRVDAILADNNGSLWLATRDGLVRFDPSSGALKRYTEKDGLPTSFTVGILQDRAGDIWLSTKLGLVRFSRSTEKFRNYDVKDGLQSNEFSSGAAAQGPDGRLFFGGTSGLNAFYPDQIRDDPYQPPVVLTGLELFNKPILPGPDSLLSHPIWQTEQLTLTHDQNVISFEFSALSYAAPQKNRYRYKLEGFDSAWNETDSARRFATYTSLPAGDYTLRVEGTNEDGVWSDQAATLKLTVLLPWWETLWFRGAVVLALIAIVIGGYRWRVYAIQQRNRELEKDVAERTHELLESTQELQRSEAALRQAKEAAEAANKAKSTFLANMSHELRSPLNAILGFAQMMGRQAGLADEGRENLSVIISSGEHLLALINQVLDLSKIESGRMTLNEVSFDLYRLLDDLHDMFSLRAKEKQLQLFFEPADDLPLYVRTDEIKLRQVLINLLNNALKFTTEGGVIVRVRQAADDPAAPLVTLQFEVEDTGPGIAEAEMDLLFEAFGQTEAGRKSQEGTGLGLPISRKFIQLMGGDITVKSQVGNGTIFAFHIQAQAVPALDEQTRVARRRVTALAPGQPTYRILVVDDHWANRQLLVRLLQPLGFEVREAENGQAAIEVWQTFAPQLIWMDMRMPVMDGFQATQHIKATTQGQATAIIALTASSFEQDRSVILSAGCDGFMRKPFREEAIFDMLTQHLGAQFVYTEPDAPVVKDTLDAQSLRAEMQKLAPASLAQLAEGAELGDMDVIAQAIATIRPQHAALADALTEIADRFEYDTLLNLIRQSAPTQPAQDTL